MDIYVSFFCVCYDKIEIFQIRFDFICTVRQHKSSAKKKLKRALCIVLGYNSKFDYEKMLVGGWWQRTDQSHLVRYISGVKCIQGKCVKCTYVFVCVCV